VESLVDPGRFRYSSFTGIQWLNENLYCSENEINLPVVESSEEVAGAEAVQDRKFTWNDYS
jgi:hypothetical protein